MLIAFKEIFVKYNKPRAGTGIEPKRIPTDKRFPVLFMQELNGEVLFYFICDTRLTKVTAAEVELSTRQLEPDNDLNIEENTKKILQASLQTLNILKHGDVKVKVLNENDNKKPNKSVTK